MSGTLYSNSQLHVGYFHGGKNRGRMLQFSTYEKHHGKLTRQQVKTLIKALQEWVWKWEE